MADRVFKPALAAACAALLLAVAVSTAAPRRGGGSGQITSSAIKNGTIRNQDIATNTITGSRIDESSLRTVPDAEAVGGNQVAKVSYRGAVGAGAIKILDLGGLQLNAACGAGPALVLEAGTTIPGSALLASTTDVSVTPGVGSTVHVPSMSAASVVPLVPAPGGPRVGQLRLMGAGGQVVTVEFGTEIGAGGGDCTVTGHAFFG
jgi:hypothetical protein